MKMQNPQAGKALGSLSKEVDLKHKNSIAFNCSSFYVSTQAPNGQNNYSSDYHNTEADDLLEIAANLMPAWEVDQ